MRMSSLPACTISLSRFVRIVESDGGCGECSRAKAVSPSLGRLVRRAAMTETQKRFVSLSSASRESQTKACCPAPFFLPRRGCRCPCREQGGLPTASRGRDERQGVRAHRIQLYEQASALDQRVGQTGRRKLAAAPHSHLLGRRRVLRLRMRGSRGLAAKVLCYLLQARQGHYRASSEIALAGLALFGVIGIPVARSAFPGLFEHTEVPGLPVEGEGGMGRQPGYPRFLVSLHHLLRWMVWCHKSIGLALGRPDECMGGWFWHRLLSNLRFHPQLPNVG